MIYQTLSLVTIVAVANGQLYTSSEENQKFMWSGYKESFNKQYATAAVEQGAFTAFLNNLKSADQRNAEETRLGGSAVHGITKFSDMPQEEFAARFLTSDPSLKIGMAQTMNATMIPKANMALVDWTGKYSTPIKDQGYCGSCWAFSATEQIESDAMRTLGLSYLLSASQITSCDKTSQGCNGGWTERAYNYVTKNGGLEQESDYPYTNAQYNGATGTCNANYAKAKITVASYTTIAGANVKTIESNMAAYVQATGPLSICLDASQFNSYRGGIMSACTTSVNHCVQAVGVDTAGGYWKVRNSWGTAWGESGYIRLSYGANTCALTNDATWVVAKAV